MKPEKHSDVFVNNSDSYQKKLYLIHHIHHFVEDNMIVHELHHCFLYTKADMKGDKYSVSHKLVANELEHALNIRFNGRLYDHDNNEFNVKDGIISL